MVKIYFIFIFILFIISGCQMAEYKNNERSPYLPVFPEIKKDEAYISNPYWIRGELFHDQQKIRLNSGKTYYPTGPSTQASIGTHYRFKNNLYVYGMTQGLGLQYDSHIWDKSKISWGILGGFNQNWGVQFLYAKKVSDFFESEITVYTTLQRRYSVTLIRCDSSTNASCAGDGTLGENRVQIGEDVFNFLVGIQAARFQLGSKGHTTLGFRFEAGTQNVLSRRILTEWYSSNYENTLSSALISVTGDLTLW